jgi:hypothetical protein
MHSSSLAYGKFHCILGVAAAEGLVEPAVEHLRDAVDARFFGDSDADDRIALARVSLALAGVGGRVGRERAVQLGRALTAVSPRPHAARSLAA